MATHLDLEEQEQLDQLKAFWKQYGNLITWVLIIALAGYVGWTLWNNHQHEQSVKAGALYEELDRAAQAGDVEKAARVFDDMKERFPSTGYAQQAALLTAKLQFDKKQNDAARATLTWASEHATEDEYRTVARLRLAGLLLDEKKFDEALKQLDGATSKEFAALVADRRGDVLLAQGKKDEAKAAFEQAWKAMDESLEYRRMVESKLMVLGAAPGAEAPKAAASAGAGK
ncbi:MAG TPA: tetratricopeptide repeat protein [Rhizobacter sp.]|nr:tetratricopeptide repeat protein [Rhizobacter sp.]